MLPSPKRKADDMLPASEFLQYRSQARKDVREYLKLSHLAKTPQNKDKFRRYAANRLADAKDYALRARISEFAEEQRKKRDIIE